MSGLDGVDELWSRLRATVKEARGLAATNRHLTAKVASLERQLAETGGLTDDELVAELPRRMSRALESAQEVAEELVGRAKKREEIIRQKTDQRTNALIGQAEAEATALLRRATSEAVGRVNEAKAQAQAILRDAHARHDQVMAELQEQSAALDDRIRQLRRVHERLTHTYGVVERTLGEAKDALRTSMGVAGSPPAAPHRADGPRPGPASSAPLYAVSDSDATVYDWSPPVSGSA
jgi:dTMP kinase